jgi:hypothetical protein
VGFGKPVFILVDIMATAIICASKDIL